MSVQKNIWGSRVFILMYYLNVVTQKISLSMHMCIHHSEIISTVKIKKAKSIQEQHLDMHILVIFQLFYHDQK